MSEKIKDLTPEELRAPLLETALKHVPFDGWSEKTLKTSAVDIGENKNIGLLAFPKGPIEMVEMLSDQYDQEMLEKAEKYNLQDLKIREKITLLVKIRIHLETKYKDVAHRTVPFLALPKNHLSGCSILYKSVDLMWKAIGDPSTDFNYYTKRLTLGAVYSSSFLYWLNDESDNAADTWYFLDRRIENVMQIEKIKAKCRNQNYKAPNIWRQLGKLRFGN